MPDPIPKEFINTLATMVACAHVIPGGRFLETTCRAATGKARSRHWRALCAAGYITPDARSGVPHPAAGTITPKAFDEVAATAAVDLAAKYTWDRFRGRCAWVSWEALSAVEKVAVAARHKRDRTAVEFLVVLDGQDRWERFYPELGEGPGDGYARLGKERGYWHGKLVVRDAAVVAKAEAAERAAYRDKVVRTALNPYLVGVGAFAKGEAGVSIADGTPTFFSTAPYLQADPSTWTGDTVESYVSRCRDRVKQAEEWYAAAVRFRDAVAAAGGVEKFREKYLAEVDDYVAKHYKPEGQQ